MTKIAVDIDDTLYSFGDLARTVMADLAVRRGDKVLQAGAYSSWNEWRTPPDIVGLDRWLEVIAISHKPENILSRTPYEGAPEVLTELAKEGNELMYISNRSESNEVFDATADWLDQNGFPLGQLVCTTGPKTEYLADCRILIDDRPKTLVEFVYDRDWTWTKMTPRVGFGLHFPYNSSLTDVPGIKLAPNWNLLAQYLRKEGLFTVPVAV